MKLPFSKDPNLQSIFQLLRTVHISRRRKLDCYQQMQNQADNKSRKEAVAYRQAVLDTNKLGGRPLKYMHSHARGMCILQQSLESKST